MLIRSFKEEYKSFCANKMIPFILLILPLLVTVLLGIELSGEVIKNIPVAVIDYDQSSFSRQLIDSFDQTETFNIVQYPSSQQELEDLLKNSRIRMGVIIPKNFYNEVTLLKSPTILMLYDGSHMSITSIAKAKATEILLTYKAGATIKQLNGRLNLSYEEAFNITQAFQYNHRMLYNPTKSFKDFLIPVLIPGSIQAALALTATVSVDQDIFTETRRKRLGYATGKVLFYTFIGALSFMLSIVTQILLLDIPFKGSIFTVLILSLGLCFSVSAFSVLLSTVFKRQIVAVTAGAIVFIPNSIMAGSTWPYMSMPIGYQAFAKYLPFTHYVNNIRNIYLKGSTFYALLDDIIYLLAFGIIMIIIDEWVMSFLENEYKKESDNNELPKDLQAGISLNL